MADRRWVCPKCSSGLNAPEKMRRDDVRRFCLACSQATGRMVHREAPALKARRATKAAQRKAAAAQATAERLAERHALGIRRERQELLRGVHLPTLASRLVAKSVPVRRGRRPDDRDRRIFAVMQAFDNQLDVDQFVISTPGYAIGVGIRAAAGWAQPRLAYELAELVYDVNSTGVADTYEVQDNLLTPLTAFVRRVHPLHRAIALCAAPIGVTVGEMRRYSRVGSLLDRIGAVGDMQPLGPEVPSVFDEVRRLDLTAKDPLYPELVMLPPEWLDRPENVTGIDDFLAEADIKLDSDDSTGEDEA